MQTFLMKMVFKICLFIHRHLVHFLKKNKESKYVIAWKSKELFKTKLFPLHGVFLPKAKCERPTMALMVQKKSNGKQTAERKFSINFSKAKK